MALHLTEHFSLDEFDQPARHGFDHLPYPFEKRHLAYQLAVELEEIRRLFNMPITIVSGYRSFPYNRKIGGARDSQHVAGRAVDFKVRLVSAADVHRACLELYDAGKLDMGGLGRYPSFTHLDIRDTGEAKPRLRRWTGSRVES